MELGQLRSLAELTLYDNNLSGPIPAELASIGIESPLRPLPPLIQLHINHFAGDPPAELLSSARVSVD